MASTKEYKDFILEQLNYIDKITYKPMMGEYILYYNGILFGGIYDDRFLIKIVKSNEKYHMEKAIPYKNGKEMYLVEELENKEILKEIIINTCVDLKNQGRK